jgi:hypothetical protein
MKFRNFFSVFILALGVLILVLCTPKSVEPQVQSPEEIVDKIMVSEDIADAVKLENKQELANQIIEKRKGLKAAFEGEKPSFEIIGEELYAAGAIIEDWEEVKDHKKYKRKRTNKEFIDLFRKLHTENATLALDVRHVFIDSIDEERTVPDEHGQQVKVNWIARIVVKFTITSPNPGNITFGGSFEALHREDCPWQNPEP